MRCGDCGRRVDLAEGGIVLAHGAVDAEAVLLRGEADRDGADAEIEGDGGGAAKDGVVEIEPARGAERGMAGELEFFAHGEDADVDAVLALDLGGAGQDEGGLAEVGLARDGLHLLGGEAARVGEDGERIAGEGLLGEDVHDGVVVGWWASSGAEVVGYGI